MDELSTITMTKDEKLNQFFSVKSSQLGVQVKDVDMNKRIVQLIANTYNFVDESGDVLVHGCCLKTINDRGPQSNATAKIKHIANHRMDTDNLVGIPLILDERICEKNLCLYAESEIVKTTKGNDHLINYQNGAYDNHSIGFRYRNMLIAEKECADESRRKAWADYYPTLINPEKADSIGMFWIIKEIELYEFSTVLFGMNSLTGVLGIKSENKDSILLNLFSRVDILEKQLKHGTQSDETMKDFSIEILQIKQIMTDLITMKPLEKGTEKPLKDSTFDVVEYVKNNSLLK